MINLKKYLLIFLIVLLLGSFKGVTKREVLIGKLRIEIGKELCKEGLIPMGSGGSAVNDKTTLISLHFEVDKKLNINETRKILLNTLTKCHNFLKTKNKLGWCFEVFPPNRSIFEITIHGMENEDVSFAYYKNDVLKYFTPNKGDYPMSSQVKYKETYEEALQELEKEQQCGNS